MTAPEGSHPERSGVDPGDAQMQVTSFWSAVAAGYETHAGNVSEYGSPDYQRWIDVLAATLPDSPAVILDVGSGSGYVALAAASLGHHVTAIDLAPAMLAELRTRAAVRGLSVQTHVSDAVEPDFPPASFDVVTCRHLLWTLREPARALGNWRRLLRPGGRMVAVEGFWFSDGGDVGPPLFAEHYTAETRAQLPFMHLNTPDPILDALSAAGFIDPTAQPRPDLTLVESGTPYLITANQT